MIRKGICLSIASYVSEPKVADVLHGLKDSDVAHSSGIFCCLLPEMYFGINNGHKQ